MTYTVVFIDSFLVVVTYGYIYTSKDASVPSPTLQPIVAPSLITCVLKCSRKGLTPFYSGDECYCSKSLPPNEVSDPANSLPGKIFNQFKRPRLESLHGCVEKSKEAQCTTSEKGSNLPPVSCQFHLGEGNGVKTVQVVQQGRDCLATCVEKRKTNPLINGVTIVANDTSQDGRCWCEVGMTGRNSDYTHSSCFLNDTGLDGDNRCTFQAGQVLGMGYATYTIKGVKGSTCIDACLRMRECDPLINAVQVMSEPTKEGCLCVKNANKRIATMTVFKSCFIGALYPTPPKYRVMSSVQKWRAADTQCELMEGHLATVSSTAQNAHLVDMMKQMSVTRAWIGYNDRWTENKFEWMANDAQKLSFTNWYSAGSVTEPNGGTNQNCVRLSDRGDWFDVGCSEVLPYICEKQANLLDGEMKIRRNNSLLIIPRLCRINTIIFDFKPIVLAGNGHVIQFCPIGVTDHTSCLFRLYYDSGSGNFRFSSKLCATSARPFCHEQQIPINTWYRVIILQEFESTTRVKYRLRVHGMEYEKTNVYARTEEDIQMFVGPDVPQIQEGYIRNLKINGMTEKNLPC